MQSLKVPFGLKGNDLVSPNDVERGLRCNCVCPGCGNVLVANHPKSKERRRYFSHHVKTGCSTGYESALHLAAKEVLKKAKRVLVPSIGVTIDLYDRETQVDASVTKTLGEKVVVLDSVEEEAREFSGVIPDIVAKIGNRLLLIEIAVTHFVDDEKLEKLRHLGHPVMEIFLEPENESPNLEEIEELVISTSHNRTWLINPKRDRLRDTAHAEAAKKLDDAKQRVLAQRQIAKDTHDRYLRLPDSQKLALELELADVTVEDVAAVIGIRMAGDRSFGVSNRVWQMYVYRLFVHEKQGNCFHADEVLEALSEKFTVQAIFDDSPQIAVYYYLKLLVERGMIKRFYAKNYSVSKDATGNEFSF